MFSINTVDMSTRMPIDRAMPPNVMMLIVAPVIQSPSIDPSTDSGMLKTTTSTLRQSRRNSKTIKPGEDGADRAFRAHVVNGGPDRRRFVKGIGDIDALGKQVLEDRACCEFRDHLQSRSGVLLDDRQIHRLLAIDQRIAVIDVGAIGHDANVPDVQIHPRLDGDIAEILHILDHGVGGHQRHLIAYVQIARGGDRVALRDGMHHVLGRQVIGP